MMPGQSYLPDLTAEGEVGEARLRLRMAIGDAALADWARRFGEPALDALEDLIGRGDGGGDLFGDAF